MFNGKTCLKLQALLQPSKPVGFWFVFLCACVVFFGGGGGVLLFLGFFCCCWFFGGCLFFFQLRVDLKWLLHNIIEQIEEVT